MSENTANPPEQTPIGSQSETTNLTQAKAKLTTEITELKKQLETAREKTSAFEASFSESKKDIAYNQSLIDKNNSLIRANEETIAENQKFINTISDTSSLADIQKANALMTKNAELAQENAKLSEENSNTEAINSVKRSIVKDKETELASYKQQEKTLQESISAKETEMSNLTPSLQNTLDYQYSTLAKTYGIGSTTSNADLGTSLTRLKANGSNDKVSSLESMANVNKMENPETKFFAKDMAGDSSDLAIVGVDQKDKDKAKKAEEQLAKDGFKAVDDETVNKFKAKNDETASAKSDTAGNAEGSAKSEESDTPKQDQVAEEPQKELSYSEKADKLEKDMKADGGYQDDGGQMEIVPGHNVKYVRVNGSNKIKFPIYENIMGLPPLTIFKSDFNNTTDLFNANIDSNGDSSLNAVKEYFLYNTDELLNNSFPTLIIHPLDVEYIFGTNGSIKKMSDADYNKKVGKKDEYKGVRYNVINEVTYKFAVTTGNNVSYNHQNTYSPGSAESGVLKTFEQFGSFTREGVQLAQTTAGMTGNSALKDLSTMGMNLGGYVDEGINEIRRTAMGVASENPKYKPIADAINSGIGLTQSILGGGRIDFPDAWQDSKTDFQQQFSIDLRTLNPDPDSDTYFYELILPLYILLTLSLPTEGNLFSYKTPPLITCSLDDSFMEIKLGAITNISWSFDMKEMNFKKVPYHCHIDLTIRDLYSVMSQKSYSANNKEYVDVHNDEITTKDEYIRRFVKTKDKKVPNEKYYLTEFAKIPKYMEALERELAKEQSAKEEDKKNLGPNGADKGRSQQPEGRVAGNSAETGKDTSNAPKQEEIRTDKKTGKKTLISSIGGFVTGITKGIRHVVSEVNKAITPVRQIINKGVTVLNAANNVKCAIKCVGDTANLPGLLNGSFAASVGLAFENLGKAGNVLEGLSGGVLGSVTKSVGGICTTLSEMGRSALTLDLPEYVSKDGKTIQLNDPFKVASSTMRATGLMVSNILNTVQGAKMIGNITKSSDPLATLTTYVNAANKIVGEVDFTDRLFNVAKGSAIETGQYTAGQLASNATIQERFRHVANTVSEQAASVASTMFNTTLAEYMMQQQWFNTYFQSTNNNSDPSNPVNIKDFKYKDEIKAAIDYANGKTDSAITPEVSWNAVKDAVMDNIDGSIQDFSKGVKEFANSTHDILIKSGFSGVVNTSGTPFDVIFTDNK